MQVIKCDKCKKELQIKNPLDSMNKVKFYFNGTLHEDITYNREYDLCSDCYKWLSDITDNFMKK